MKELSQSHDLDDYSASSTTVPFDPPLPLLRGPAADTTAGSHVLSFRDGGAWRIAFRACESRITEQCEAAARIGCAVSASSRCRPPWWLNLIGPKVSDLKEREMCEEKEMEGCLATTKEKCSGFAREKCLRSFAEARVVARGIGGASDRRVAEDLVCLATVMDKSFWVDLIGLNRLALLRRDLRVKSYKASDLVGRNPEIDCILGCCGENEKSNV